jgi:Protein of unknown function (DUF1488)
MSEIIFLSGEAWDGMREVVRFRARVGDQQVPCAISFEALQDQRHFHEDLGPPIDTFRRHRPVIEELARKLIQQRRFEPDGAILIRAQDW